MLIRRAGPVAERVEVGAAGC